MFECTNCGQALINMLLCFWTKKEKNERITFPQVAVVVCNKTTTSKVSIKNWEVSSNCEFLWKSGKHASQTVNSLAKTANSVQLLALDSPSRLQRFTKKYASYDPKFFRAFLFVSSQNKKSFYIISISRMQKFLTYNEVLRI